MSLIVDEHQSDSLASQRQILLLCCFLRLPELQIQASFEEVWAGIVRGGRVDEARPTLLQSTLTVAICYKHACSAMESFLFLVPLVGEMNGLFGLVDYLLPTPRHRRRTCLSIRTSSPRRESRLNKH